VARGSHTLSAVATDVAGNSASSARVFIRITWERIGMRRDWPGSAASYALAITGPSVKRVGACLPTREVA
jgi:hypothetical protein